MKEKVSIGNPHKRKRIRLEKDNPEGYPLYPESEDIYGKYHKEGSIDPEDPPKIKGPTEILKTGAKNEKDFSDDLSGSDLDIPGSEENGERELSGNEDEENNFYSLGGDDHNDLEEDSGE
jgi:hypothetical protein